MKRSLVFGLLLAAAALNACGQKAASTVAKQQAEL